MTAPATTPATVGLAARLPSWAGSIRARLTLLYAVLVFGLSAVVTAGVYVGVYVSLREEPVSQTFNLSRVVRTPRSVIEIPEGTFRGQIQ
ncbi:MAG TPA: hypothetical protein VD926_02675, partial [Acidimicrobiales bacterium]|nr:hypothetical protein [Acidimicrobiales bacterium]